MPRPKNTEARRAEIIDAFLTVMAELGYDGASTAEIAREAGLRQGLIHYHFADKEAVLVAALEALAKVHETRLDAVFDAAGPDPLARIAAFIDVHLGLGAHADPRALRCWVAMGSEAARKPAVRVAYAAAIDALTARLLETLDEAAALGKVHCEDPAAAAAALVAVVQGYFELAVAVPERIPRGSAGRSARAMATGLLRPVAPLEAS